MRTVYLGGAGAGATVATYVYGWYLDEVLSMERDTDGDGITEHYFFHADDLYNVTSVTDAGDQFGNGGKVVERVEYGDYGQPTIKAGPAHPDVVAGIINEGDVVVSTLAGFGASTIGNPYLFNGRRYDPESTFYWYRTRYLDPIHGRFTTRDTIGTWGDPTNLGNGYAYVGNNPWTKVDPYGLGGLLPGPQKIPWDPNQRMYPRRPGQPNWRRQDLNREKERDNAARRRANSYMRCLGGRNSWLDNKNTVNKVSWCLSVCATPVVWWAKTATWGVALLRSAWVVAMGERGWNLF